jgi:uncharacterized protein YabE (DUF348 family)/3D (Asp-Asp-Asp) domain-containing protein
VGTNQNRQTHVKRSTSLSYPINWKPEHLRAIVTGTILTLAFTLIFVLLLYGTSEKTVIISIDGKEQILQTSNWSVDNVLEEHEIVLSEHDDISVPVKGKVKHGDRIVIHTAKPVHLTVDGRTETMHLTSKTVGDALQSLQITLGEEDRVSPAVTEPITAETDIKVTRVLTVVEELEEVVPFDTIEEKDAKLIRGKEKTIQSGQEGLLTKTIKKIYEDGELVSQKLVAEQVKAEKIDEVIAIGTQEPVMVLSALSPVVEEVTKSGITFGVKRKLEGVKLTAYDAGFNSTGKNKGDPQYGITFSGSTVAAGRTVAVDPKIIPLGWWIYIEGYGFRKAEDIGSGVKGKHVDIYMEEEDEANKFGLKKGHTVYVIGPNNPQLN